MALTGQLRDVQAGCENSRWYALHTMYNCEAKVAGYLEAFGIDVFLPDYASRRTWHDRVKVLRLPIFPGYLFGRFKRKLPNSALNAPGLAHVVSFADGPAAIPDDQIESVRKMVQSGLKLYGSPMLKVGKRVRINSGPLKGVEGRLEQIKSQYRLVVAVDLLGRSVAAEIDPDCIEALS